MQFTTDIDFLLASDFLQSTLPTLKNQVCYIYIYFETCIFTCKQTALHHFTGLLIVFKRLSEAKGWQGSYKASY